MNKIIPIIANLAYIGINIALMWFMKYMAQAIQKPKIPIEIDFVPHEFSLKIKIVFYILYLFFMFQIIDSILSIYNLIIT
jgi:hypothetical protein